MIGTRIIIIMIITTIIIIIRRGRRMTIIIIIALQFTFLFVLVIIRYQCDQKTI